MNSLFLAFILFYISTYSISTTTLLKENSLKSYNNISVLLLVVFISSFFFLKWYLCILALISASLIAWIINKISKNNSIIQYPLLIISIILFSYYGFYGNPIDRKISSDSAYQYLINVTEKLDSISAVRLEEEYKRVLILSVYGSQGKAGIITLYGKKFEHLTFKDLIDKIEEKKKIEIPN
jgi:hypothetical protein